MSAHLRRYQGYSIFVVIVIVLSGCRKSPESSDKYLDRPLCDHVFTPGPTDIQVVGFYPSWNESRLSISDIPWNRLTRIVYAFATPLPDGNIDTRSLVSVKQLTDSAHQHGIEIYFSVGGGDGSSNFPALAGAKESRDKFVKEVRQYVFENCLDGVDIDWEYWTGSADNIVIPSESSALVEILRSLKTELSPFNLGISVDLEKSDWAGKNFYDDVSLYADHLQVMCYDFSGPWSAPGPHSSYEDAIGSGSTVSSTGLAYWVNFRGWPKEKILLGVPFFGRDFDNQGGNPVAYDDIIKLSPDAYLNDRINNIYYNGIVTMAKKAQYVSDNGFAGIMIWEITLDSFTDSTSLLYTIDKILKP